MNERIKELRKALKLTQQEFADRIGSNRANIAQYEIGRNDPSVAVITLICREFHVNEVWLRTGEGKMFRQQSREDSIRAFFEDVLTDEPNSFRLHFISALSKLTPAQWEVIADLAEKITSENETSPSVEELEEEYKKSASGSASNGGSNALNTTKDTFGVA